MSNTLQGTAGPLYVRDAPAPGSFIRGTLVFPATVNVADPAGLTDNNTTTLSLDATGRLRVVLSGAAPVTTVATQPVRTDDTSTNAARTVAPGAGAVLATLTPAAGTYIIDLLAFYDGAVAAAELNNLEVRRGGVVFQTPILIPSLANVIQRYQWRVALSGAQAFDVRAIAAGTAGIGYNMALYFNRLI